VLTPVDAADFRLRALRQLRRPSTARSQAGEDAELVEPTIDADRASPVASRQGHDTLLRLIDVIPRMICVTGRDGRYILVNRMFAAFVGVPARRLIGKRP